MEDPGVIRAFVSEGGRRGFVPALHIEGDCLFFDGWRQTALRVDSEVRLKADLADRAEGSVIEHVLQYEGQNDAVDAGG